MSKTMKNLPPPNQTIEEIIDSMNDNPREWAEMFLEARRSIEQMRNLIEAYQQLLKPFVNEEKTSNIH